MNKTTFSYLKTPLFILACSIIGWVGLAIAVPLPIEGKAVFGFLAFVQLMYGTALMEFPPKPDDSTEQTREWVRDTTILASPFALPYVLARFLWFVGMFTWALCRWLNYKTHLAV